MSITSQRRLASLRSGLPDARIAGRRSAPQHRGRSQPIKPRPSRLPAVMGPPNHAPGSPVMGAPSGGLHLHLMGRPHTGPRVDPMGGPDTALRVDLMGESDVRFVDSLFSQRRSLR